ncbi:MAG: RNA methyltransferase [Pseudoflavonifractor sp.]|nr:RNA methyltransferase [Alloprevotella sp.]MCM1116025.1 RNA methyltransferase [Pseudoflavonifractor sp.]
MDLPTFMGRELRHLVASLDDAKGRRSLKLWKAEGSKCAGDMLGLFPCPLLIALPQWLGANPVKAAEAANIVEASPRDMERLSRLQSPPPVIALFEMTETEMPSDDNHGLMLALDTIQDPGNLGTIIRTADWMGISDIIATRHTADCFSPKVAMATMGALSRVRVHYVDTLAEEMARRRAAGARILGTFLDGNDIFAASLPPQGQGCILIMGNEGRGISPEVEATVSDRLLIPPYPAGAVTSESLNVGAATAIALARLRFGRQ